MLDVACSNKCNGCHACFSVCPLSAIQMRIDNEGFLYPIIDYEKCTSCGKCEETCPILNPFSGSRVIPDVYACKNKSEAIRFDSSSGGVFSLLAENIIEQNGIVFGAKFAKDFSVVHSWTDSVNGISAFRGSKYVQSDIGESFIKCKQFLEEGRKVLFSGTPCQIGGLKAFLGKEYILLFCVDIICHGVPSPSFWKKYKDYQQIKYCSKITQISFRRKNFGWKRYSVSFSFKNRSEYLVRFNKDKYMQIFLWDFSLRPSCYNCSFKTIQRVSDITLADLWGIQTILPEFDDDRGVSLVFTHTIAARNLLESLVNVEFVRVDADEAIHYNQSIVKSAKFPNERNQFFNDLNMMRFSKFLFKYMLIINIKSNYYFIKKVVNKVGRLARKLNI